MSADINLRFCTALSVAGTDTTTASTALAASAAPVLSERGGASLAAWGDAAHYFVVVSKAGRTPLEKIL